MGLFGRKSNIGRDEKQQQLKPPSMYEQGGPNDNADDVDLSESMNDDYDDFHEYNHDDDDASVASHMEEMTTDPHDDYFDFMDPEAMANAASASASGPQQQLQEVSRSSFPQRHTNGDKYYKNASPSFHSSHDALKRSNSSRSKNCAADHENDTNAIPERTNSATALVHNSNERSNGHSRKREDPLVPVTSSLSPAATARSVSSRSTATGRVSRSHNSRSTSKTHSRSRSSRTQLSHSHSRKSSRSAGGGSRSKMKLGEKLRNGGDRKSRPSASGKASSTTALEKQEQVAPSPAAKARASAKSSPSGDLVEQQQHEILAMQIQQLSLLQQQHEQEQQHPSPAHPIDESETTRDLVKTFIGEIWNRGEISSISKVCSPRLRFNSESGLEKVGHEGFSQMVLSVRSSLEDYHCEIHSMVVEGRKCFCRLKFTGKHVGTLLGCPATHKLVSWSGASEFTVCPKRHQILKVWELGDIKTLEKQLKID